MLRSLIYLFQASSVDDSSNGGGEAKPTQVILLSVLPVAFF